MIDVELDISKISSGINSNDCSCYSISLKPHFIPNNLLHLLDADSRMRLIKNRIYFNVRNMSSSPLDSFHVWIDEFLIQIGFQKCSGFYTLSLDSEIGRFITASLMFTEDEDFRNIESAIVKAKLEGKIE